MTKKVNIDIVAKDKTKKAVESSKRGLGGIKKFALAASAALATIGAGKAIGSLVNVGKEIESLQIRFKLLFGSAEEGARAFDTLTQFAGRVPFSLQDIAAASGNLAVVAKDAKELNDILEITGNVAGATGLDFQTTASQIQRAFSGGIASADIFREKGVRDMLGFSAGAKISVEETREAFARVFAGNGEFAKTTEELAGTLEGTLSMINDKFFQFQLAINKSFFEELKNQFGDLNTFLAQNEEEIKEFGEDIGQVLAKSITTLAEAVKVVKENVAEFELAIGALLLASKGLMKIIGGAVLVFDSFGRKQRELIEQAQEYARVLSGIDYEDHIMRIARATQAQDENNVVVGEAVEITDEMTASMIAFDEGLRQQKESLASVKDEVQALTKAEDEWFSQRASASRQSLKDQKNKQSEIEAEKKAKLGLFNQAKEFAEEGAQRSKKLFKLNQALAVGEAIMNTYQGATKALAQGGIFGMITAGLVIATGMAQVANIRAQQPPAQFGGSRQQGTPFLVGERGPELFTPATAGTVTPNHQLGKGSTVVNFNINTVSAKGFNELLQGSRGMIVNMINTAVNERGRANLV